MSILQVEVHYIKTVLNIFTQIELSLLSVLSVASVFYNFQFSTFNFLPSVCASMPSMYMQTASA